MGRWAVYFIVGIASPCAMLMTAFYYPETQKNYFVVKYLIDGPEKYLLTDEGKIHDYLGMEINPGPN